MTHLDAVRALEAAIHAAPRSLLPAIIGDLARLDALARAAYSRPDDADELLTAEEAAGLLRISPATVYRNAGRYPFARREGRLLRFSRRGLQEHIGGKR